MCAVAAIPIIVTAAAGIFSAISAAQSAAADNRAKEYNAAAQRQNAANAMLEAGYAREKAAQNANVARLKSARLMGAQRAKMGASGAVAASGSFLDVLMNTAAEGEREAMGIMQEGDISAWRHEVQAGQYETQARLTLSSKQDPNMVLAGGLLQAGASTAKSAYGMSGFMGGGG